MITKIPFSGLEAIAAKLRATDSQLRAGYEQLTGELRSTMAEWGDDTDSRAAYDQFKTRCDRAFLEMADALAKIPVAVEQVRTTSIETERANAATFQ
ncbi:WXG100 family type VII secretion target [Cellulomonas aerilata]|uniref:ESAT-6-like protein n=1 Tax=Cellulomonas aerilata TaxID=515326 RepID=A0A512DFP5_9CELL|nr:hypothetical protein [Cellulomonas aerilata]GEO35246.1 hypothetical protein CAE01nite_29710 [Cellulomonas aerilata]